MMNSKMFEYTSVLIHASDSQEHILAPRVHGLRDAQGRNIFYGGQGEDD